MSEIRVSIIIPIYKTPENLLRACVESAIRQTDNNIEVLLVDDSPEETGKICDEYVNQDPRVRVFHQKKGGLSAGRNKGFLEAKGKWITFLDSDDWLDKRTCEKAVALGEEKNADVVLFGTIQEFNGRQKAFTYHFENETVFSGKECLDLQKEVLNNYGNIATAWAKLFRRDFLNSNELLHDAELSQGSEGVEFNIRVFKYATNVVFTNEPFYHYVYYTNSLSAAFNENNYVLILKCLEKIKNEISKQSNYKELYPLWSERVLSVLVAMAVGGYFSPKYKATYSEKKRAFRNMISDDCIQEALKNPHVDNMGISRRFVLKCIKSGVYFPVVAVAAVRYFQKNR